IYAAAGGTGLGVLQAAADEGILSIGVDSNQNHLHPGKVLTSAIKRVDVAVYNAFKAGTDVEVGKVNVWDVAHDGVGVAMDDNNKPLVSEEMGAAVEAARTKIAAGELTVVNYNTNSACPVE
ncbi:MAG: BMP family ABC transporter substrate-binding protein, partial [Paracoccus sp. (in: a-proteobacteria)]|nr:BMP family ABC transporter substrate-binding protein [Paracoccus sp. (in: a-proteobacteria)]